MAERFILKKSVRKGSLVRRILWGMTLFVVLPLVVHTVFLYFREYQGDIDTVNIFLNIVRRDKVDFFQQVIAEKKGLLSESPIEDLHQFGAKNIPSEPNVPVDGFFTRVDLQNHAFWVGKNFSSGEAIGFPVHLDEWIEKWRYLEKYEYPLFMTIQDQKGELVAGRAFNSAEKRVVVQEQIGDTGLILKLSVPESAIQVQELKYHAFSVMSLLVFVGLLGGGGVILFARRIAKPFEALCHVMERVSEGAVHVRYEPDKMGFEINTLGKQFNQTLDELLKRTEEVEKERIKREKLAQELKIGHAIQLSMLPASLPSFSGLDVAPGYIAAQEVSGDFYDLFQIDSDRLLFVVADSAGKGISACLYSLGFRSALRAFAGSSRFLAEIVQRANELLMLDTADSGFFITAWIGLYDAAAGRLQYCSQGHPPALLKRNGSIQELSTDGIAFGVQSFSQNAVQEIAIANEDVLLLYTDGVLEAHHFKEAFFGLDRVKQFLLSSSQRSSAAYISSFLQTLKNFAQDTPQYDDITLLMMKFFR